MTRLCRLAPLMLLASTAAARAHPGHEVGNLEHLVESPDHWLPLVIAAVLMSGFAILAIKLWRNAGDKKKSAEAVRVRAEDPVE